MKSYHWTLCEPDQPAVIDKGKIREKDIMDTFIQYPWMEKLELLSSLPEEKKCFSPSLGFEDPVTGQEVIFSFVGDHAGTEFYIFYKRDKRVSVFWGLSKRLVKGMVSDITGQRLEDAQAFLEAFLRNDTAYMEEKIAG